MRVSMSAIGSCMLICLHSRDRLPASLLQARNFALHHVLTHLDAAQTKLAQVSVRTTSDVATITLTNRTGITRQLLQLEHSFPTRFIRSSHVRDDRLQRRTLLEELFDQFGTLYFTCFHGKFCHNPTPYLRNGKLKAASRARPSSSDFAVVVIVISR